LEEKNWIAGAIKKPGAMTAAAKREGESTSEYIKKHEHDSGKAGKRARLAKTLKSFKESNEENSIYDQMIQEVLSKDASAGAWIHDFVHSDNPKFAGKSKEQRKKQALAAYYAKQRNEEVEQIDEVSMKTAVSAYAKRTDNAQEHGHSGDDEGSDKEFKKADKLHGQIEKRWGKKGTKAANKAVQYKTEEVEQIDESLKTKTAYVPYVYTDKHGSGFGGYDVHYSKESDAHAHVAKHGHIDNNGKKGWVEKHELAKHPHTGGWVEANHLRRHGLAEDAEQVDEKLNLKKKTMDTLKGRVEVPAGTHNQHSDTKVELNSEGWDDMVKSAKDAVKTGPKPSGGSGVKQGTRYGGGKQTSKPEQDEDDKKKVTESKRPEDDSVPFATPYNTTSAPADVKDKSGAVHTPMSRAKHLASLAMKRVKKDLGK
jgi:hypothetical protein